MEQETTIKGVVTEFDWTHPHVYIGIDATDDPAPRASLACSWSCC